MSPTRGEFDVTAVRRYLDAQPDTFADPHGTDFYIVGGMPEAVQGLWEERKQDATRFPYAVLIEVTPKQVTLVQEFANQYNLRSALEFARWMWNHSNVVVRDYYGRDVTEDCRAEGVDALYPDSVRNAGMPWAGRLIKVGFFRELDHGDIGGSSLEESRAETPAPDEARRTSSRMADMPGRRICPTTCASTIFGYPSTSSSMLRAKHFLLHAARNDFQIPASVDVASLKLE